VNPSESSNVWGEYLEKLRKRGFEQVDLIVVDGLSYFAKEAKNHYPKADIQKCVGSAFAT
ncbi:MAG: transposase, partial [Bacteroidota bacterium]